MQPIRQFFRSFKIFYITLKYGLDRALFRLPFFRAFKWIAWFNPFYWQIKRQKLNRGTRLRLALEELGPLFVKFGQLLSTRRDFLPDDIIIELSKLQDRVPPFDSAVAVAAIEAELGCPVTDIFDDFSQQALASASISQVHEARLKSGEAVVVKILRPHIEEEVNGDIALLLSLTHFLERASKSAKRIRLKDMINELGRTLENELDLIQEAANASQFRRQFKTSPLVSIPKVHWDYTRKRVLVMDRIYGIPVNQVSLLRQKGFNLTEVAKRGIEIFYIQVFENAFFHADMHPGNLFIAEQPVHLPHWILIDFGIVGTLSKENQHYLAANFLAFIDRNYRRVAELHLESKWVPAHVRVDVLESAIRSVCEPLFELPQNQVSLGQTLLRLIQIARRFKMEVMPELLLLQKTLVSIEGVAKHLDPDIDMWKIARPILEKWMRRHIGLGAFLKRLRDELPAMSERLPEIPQLIYQALKKENKKPEIIIVREKNRFFTPVLFCLGLVMGIVVTWVGVHL